MSRHRATGFLFAGLLVACLSILCAGCASNRSLYVYRAYQDPRSARGPYYLRKALVAAPDHSTAINIIVQTMSDVHPGCTGPLYLSFLGVAEDRREPGLLGGPVWVEAVDESAEEQAVSEALAKDKAGEGLSHAPYTDIPSNIP